MLKLALRNIQSKPLRAIATILAIAVAVAMIFCMLSFKEAVYEYIYSLEVSSAGDSDILISKNSSGDRIFMVDEALKSMSGVDNIVPSLNLYALVNDEYVQLRGFEEGHIEDLQSVVVLDGDIATLNNGVNIDNVIISRSCANHFSLEVGNRIQLSLGKSSIYVYVGAIAEDSGYFLKDAPYQLIGLTKHIAGLLSSSGIYAYNEIYVKANDGVKIEDLIYDIGNIAAYSNTLITPTKDGAYVKEQTESLTAPVVLAGGAVLVLGIAIIFLLFMMSEKEKLSLISKLSVVGASRKQLFALFLIESSILAGVGVLIGSILSVGVFVGLIKLTLSTNIIFNISVLKLFGASIIGLISAILASILPIFRSLNGSIRENMLDIDSKPLWTKILPIILVVLTIIFVVLEFILPMYSGVFAILSLVFAIATLTTCVPYVLKGFSTLLKGVQSPSISIATKNVLRQKMYARSVTMLSVGVTISVMLFMAWSLTTTIFTTYTSSFKNMAFISNIQSSVDIADFRIEGVENAQKLVWTQAELRLDNVDKTMNILGSKDMLDVVDFEFITSKDEVYNNILSDQMYVFVDIALNELYGVDVGDTLSLTIDNIENKVIVGGILKHELFSGNYLVMNERVLDELFDKKPDTVLVTISGDISMTVGALREKFASRNYYVIEALEMYKWDMQSMNSVFDLIGTLAVVVSIFVFIVSVTSTLIGRGQEQKTRRTLLNAGMSKKALLKSEMIEFALVAIVSFILSIVISVLLTSSLIHALRLFGLYFEFMYEAWVVIAVSGVMCCAFALIPLVFNFKKGYNIKRR